MLWLAILLLLSGPASADSGMLMSGVANRRMPLDAITAPTACYSERRLRTAYATNKGINIVRASDSTTSDIGFTAAGYPDKATETTFCASTTCKLVTMYDQCGSNNLTQATDANRYTRQSGPGVFNSSQVTAATQTHAGGSNITPATGLVSLAVISIRSAGTGTCVHIRENGATANRLFGRSGASGATLAGGTSGSIVIGAAAGDGSWHSLVGVINGASSVFAADGAESSGTTTGNTTAGVPAILGAASTTCNIFESVIWDNVGLTAGERLFIANGARSALGF